MRLLEQLRRFWLSTPTADHLLAERERWDDRPVGTYDERVQATQALFGADFDPDESHRSQ